MYITTVQRKKECYDKIGITKRLTTVMVTALIQLSTKLILHTHVN